MLAGIIGGCIVGALNPVVKDASGEVISKGATVLEPIGTVFINLMFCVVVPMVFCSIASAIANMSSAKRAGKVMGITIGTFFVTAAIAAVIMYVIVRIFPIVSGDYTVVEGEVGTTLSVTDMIINFFIPCVVDIFLSLKCNFGHLCSYIIFVEDQDQCL